MPTPTYVALGTITLASTDSEIVFSSIPATYRDLILVFDGTANTSAGFEYNLNGDTNSSNYSTVDMTGNGSTTSSSSSSSSFSFMSVGTTQSNSIFQFMDYSATDKHKTSLSRQNRTDVIVRAEAKRWANTAAIHTIRIYDSAGSANFRTGSTFSLYGVN